ncbi:hypothetical protein BHE74_00050807, partial [Ensete ventricosum]
FAEGFGKLARNTPGDCRRKIVRLTAVESGGCRIAGVRSEGSKEEGRPATASPHAGPAPASTAGGSRWLQGARKGLSPVASLAASRGDDVSRRGGRPFTGRLPVA